jgi:predicted cupin superfamily sugar epimerase
MNAEYFIEKLQMQPLPVEGGYFTVTHLAEEDIGRAALPARYPCDRPFYSAIYYLVTVDQFSAMHKLPTDEIYYFHYGDPLELLLLAPDGSGTSKQLGLDIEAGQLPQILAPKHWWQGSRPLPGGDHGFSLVSTSMAPAYMESDPEFGQFATLTSKYPQFAEMIKSLTRK